MKEFLETFFSFEGKLESAMKDMGEVELKERGEVLLKELRSFAKEVGVLWSQYEEPISAIDINLT